MYVKSYLINIKKKIKGVYENVLRVVFFYFTLITNLIFMDKFKKFQINLFKLDTKNVFDPSNLTHKYFYNRILLVAENEQTLVTK